MPLILEIRFFIGSLILGTIFLYNINNYYELRKLPQLSLMIKLCLFAQAACGGFLFNYFLAKGLAYSGATYAGAITSLVPLFVALFSILFMIQVLALLNFLPPVYDLALPTSKR